MRDDSYIFEQYLDGTMSQKEIKTFLNRLKDDPDYAARFELYKRLDDFMRRQQSYIFAVRKVSEHKNAPDPIELSDIEKEIREYYKQSQSHDELKNIRNKLDEAYENLKKNESDEIKRSSWLGIAASIVILLSLTFLFYFFQVKKHVSAEACYQEFYSPYPCLLMVRGVAISDTRQQWSEALKNYDVGNYAASLQCFRSLDKAYSGNDLRWLYEGICCMELKEYGEASESFQQILNRPKSLLRNQALWYMSLVMLKQQETQQALEFLHKIDRDGSQLSDHAEKVIRMLE